MDGNNKRLTYKQRKFLEGLSRAMGKEIPKEPQGIQLNMPLKEYEKFQEQAHDKLKGMQEQLPVDPALQQRMSDEEIAKRQALRDIAAQGYSGPGIQQPLSEDEEEREFLKGRYKPRGL